MPPKSFSEAQKHLYSVDIDRIGHKTLEKFDFNLTAKKVLNCAISG
jgi:hypothetical protein